MYIHNIGGRASHTTKETFYDINRNLLEFTSDCYLIPRFS